jgi:hypothetical protein
MDSDRRMDRVERRLDATLKIVQTGMKMLVKMQEDTRTFKKETREGISALIAAQMRSEAKLDRFITSLGRSGGNGHTY